MVLDKLQEEETIISAREYAAMIDAGELEGHTTELVAGEIVTMAKPKLLHGLVLECVYDALKAYARAQGGNIITGETGIVTRERADGRDTVRGLDLGYFRAGRLDDEPTDEHIRVAPDIAVEVMSPGNEVTDIDRKISEYQAMGCPFVWIVVPQTRHVWVYAGDSARRYTDGDSIDGGELLPELRVAVSALFPAQRQDDDEG